MHAYLVKDGKTPDVNAPKLICIHTFDIARIIIHISINDT